MRISDWSSDVCSSDLSNYEAFRRRSERRFKDADRDHQAMLMISQDYDNKMNLLVLRSFSKLPCRQPPTIANGLHVHRHIQPKWALPIQDVARHPTFSVESHRGPRRPGHGRNGQAFIARAAERRKE